MIMWIIIMMIMIMIIITSLMMNMKHLLEMASLDRRELLLVVLAVLSRLQRS